MTEVALATSIPPAMRRPGPGGEDAGPAWRLACAESWPAPGWRVMSVNPTEELPMLGIASARIETLPAAPGVAAAYGRSGTWIADALGRALASGAPVVGIVNADIRLDLGSERRRALIEHAGDAMIAFNRMDIGHAGQAEGPFYRYGYDLVLMPRRIAERLDMTGLAFGVPWWDYWMVLDALLQGLPVHVVQCAGIRHLAHRQAWNRAGWQRALRVMMARAAPRRAAFARLGLGAVAMATVDLLSALGTEGEAGYPLAELMEVAGTRFGLEVVRLAERSAWRLD